MANYYMQFSEIIPTKTDEERDFFARGFGFETLVDKLVAAVKAGGTYSKSHDYAKDAEALYIAEFGEAALEAMGVWGYQDCSIDDDGIWVHAEEGSNPELIAEVVAAWQKKFKIQQAWSLTYSVGYNTPRIGSFSGGGFVIYKGRIHWMGAIPWVDGKKAALKKASTRKKKAKKRPK